MVRILPALAVLLLPAVAPAQFIDNFDGSKPAPGELNNPTIGAPLGANDPADHRATPDARSAPLPSTPVELERLRGQLIGKSVYGSGVRIGEVVDLAVGADQRVANVVVRVDAQLDPDRANLPVPWNWVAGQLDAPTLIVPWNSALVAWLTEPGRSRRTAAPAVAVSAPLRADWQQQAAAELDSWRDRIDGEALRQGERDSNVRQLRIAWGAARDRLDRLAAADQDAWPVEQGKLQADLDQLRQSWTELAEAPP